MTTGVANRIEPTEPPPEGDPCASRLPSMALKRNDLWLAFALASLVLIAGYSRMVVGVCGIYHDDAVYVSTAKALAEGDGYGLINVPGSPVQTRFPIVYPALLSVVWSIWPAFPENLGAMQGLSLLAAAATVAAAYLYLVRFGYFSRRIAFASGLLCATSASFLFFSTQTLSEMPFALLLLGAIWAIDRDLRAPSSTRKRQVFLGVLLGLPFLCRSIGVALIPVGVLVLYRAGRPLRRIMAGAAAVTLPWLVWTWSGGNHDPLAGYHSDYLGWWSSFGALFLQDVVAANTVLLAISTTTLGFEGLTDALFSLDSKIVPSIVAFSLGLVPWLAILLRIRPWRVLPCLLVVYLAIVLVWPWPPLRFLVPILPFIVPFMLQGASVFLKRCIAPRRRTALATMAIVVAVSANVSLLCRHRDLSRHTGYAYVDLKDTRVSWSSYEGVFDWLRHHARAEDVVASAFDPMIYLYTGLQGFRPFSGRPAALFYRKDVPAVGTLDEFVECLGTRRPRFLVQFPLPGFSEEKHFAELLSSLRTKYPSWLQPVYQGKDERFVIYEVRPDMAPPVRSAESLSRIRLKRIAKVEAGADAWPEGESRDLFPCVDRLGSAAS